MVEFSSHEDKKSLEDRAKEFLNKYVPHIIVFLVFVDVFTLWNENHYNNEQNKKNFQIVSCQSKYNDDFATAAAVRSDLNSRQTQTIINLIESFGTITQSINAQETIPQHDNRQELSLKLFSKFQTDMDDIDQARKNNPLPQPFNCNQRY